MLRCFPDNKRISYITAYSGSPLMRSQSSSFSDANRDCQRQKVLQALPRQTRRSTGVPVLTVSGD
jgi:hypothetical protein